MALGGIVLTWTSLLVFTIKLYTLSGATAQWYFAPVGGARLEGATMRSLKYALGPNVSGIARVWAQGLPVAQAIAAGDEIGSYIMRNVTFMVTFEWFGSATSTGWCCSRKCHWLTV